MLHTLVAALGSDPVGEISPGPTPQNKSRYLCSIDATAVKGIRSNSDQRRSATPSDRGANMLLEEVSPPKSFRKDKYPTKDNTEGLQQSAIYTYE